MSQIDPEKIAKHTGVDKDDVDSVLQYLNNTGWLFSSYIKDD